MVSMWRSESPITRRSRARPTAKADRSPISASSWSWRSATVDTVRPRLVSIASITSSRRASPEVSEPVRAIRRAHRHPLALEGLDDVHRQRVDVVGVERAEQRLEAVEQGVEVERRRRARHRDQLVGGLARVLPALRLDQGEVPPADEVEVAQLGAGGGAHRQVGLHLEADPRRRVGGQADLGDAADAHSSDHHVVAGPGAAGRAEDRGVGGLVGAERQRPDGGRHDARP